MRQTFEAIIGALASTSQTAASRLVLDLVATQLHGLDLTDLWDVNDPMAILTTVLANENRGQPEARLLWASGKETMLACYHVGIYSDQELIGQGTKQTFS
jgi:large subunit ribosomal protein L44